MKKIIQLLFCAAFILLLFCVPIITFTREKIDTSLYENRGLAQLPQPTKENLLSGKYFSQFETYFSDSIVGRNSMLRLYTQLQMNVLQKPVVNDVVLLDDILLPFNKFTYPPYPDYKKTAAKMAQTLDEIGQLTKENGGMFYYVSIPEQKSFFKDRYPWYLNNDATLLALQKEAFLTALDGKEVQFIDMETGFDAIGRDTKYYSTVDHHFTFKGAYQTYRYIIAQINQTQGYQLDTVALDALGIYDLPRKYLGSRNRKLFGQYTPTDGTDKADLGGAPLVPFQRITDGQEIINMIFSIPHEQTEYITFDVYMGGDAGETSMQTNRTELPNLLIFGDSFTNPLEPLLYTSFNETRILDYRYYSEKTLTQYIREFKPDVVLCIRDDTAYFNTDGNGDRENLGLKAFPKEPAKPNK